jgi:nucleotide-binding universal stress UspA family protein
MLKTILLPLDGSPLAERALTYAAVLARRCEARVVLVEAVPSRSLPGVDPSDAQAELHRHAESYLNVAAGRLSAAGIATETHVVIADPVQAILDAAARQHADLIVMSTHGRGGLGRMLYGSVADQVLRRATVPVLLVPSIVEHAWPAEGPRLLLLPLDGSGLATEAFASATLLAEPFDSQLALLHVVPPMPHPVPGEGYAYASCGEDAEVAEAQRYLDNRATRFARCGVSVSTSVVVGDPARVIGEVAREQNADVVVMATHGRGGLSRLMLGSVATATLRHTTVPLLLVRPSTAHAAEPASTTSHDLSSPQGGTAMPLSTLDQPVDRVVSVQLSDADLELIDHSLRSLGHAPGYDYGHVLAARALADRLRHSSPLAPGEPIASR